MFGHLTAIAALMSLSTAFIKKVETKVDEPIRKTIGFDGHNYNIAAEGKLTGTGPADDSGTVNVRQESPFEIFEALINQVVDASSAGKTETYWYQVGETDYFFLTVTVTKI